jgi:hypothetical protein
MIMSILDLLTSTEKAFARSREADLDTSERLFILIRKLAADIASAREYMGQLQNRIERLEAGESGGEP